MTSIKGTLPGRGYPAGDCKEKPVTFDSIILAGIVAMFLTFIAVLGGVSIWTWLARADAPKR